MQRHTKAMGVSVRVPGRLKKQRETGREGERTRGCVQCATAHPSHPFRRGPDRSRHFSEAVHRRMEGVPETGVREHGRQQRSRAQRESSRPTRSRPRAATSQYRAFTAHPRRYSPPLPPPPLRSSGARELGRSGERDVGDQDPVSIRACVTGAPRSPEEKPGVAPGAGDLCRGHGTVT